MTTSDIEVISLDNVEEKQDYPKFELPEWFTDKKVKYYKNISKRLYKLRFLHAESSKYFNKLSLVISIPSIIITAVSACGGFLSTSNHVNDNMKVPLNITMGVLGVVATMMHTISVSCKFSSRIDAHRKASDSYHRLYEKTINELSLPNEPDFHDKVEEEMIKTETQCAYFPPYNVHKLWNKVKHSEMN